MVDYTGRGKSYIGAAYFITNSDHAIKIKGKLPILIEYKLAQQSHLFVKLWVIHYLWYI